jgi:alpha-ketoglutarate-dependent taurine dioxygenase
MTLAITPLTDHFVARVEGVDLSAPLAPATVRAVHDALHTHHVLVFPGQTLTPEQHIAMTAQFGTLFRDQRAVERGDAHPELMVIGNLNPLGDTFVPPSNDLDFEEWHSDHSHREIPARSSMLYARAVPETGGETWFTNMHAAYDALPPELRERVEQLRAVHSGAALHDWRVGNDPAIKPLTPERRAEIPSFARPMVLTHPVTGRKALYFGSKIVASIEGLDAAEARSLLRDLSAHIAEPRFVYKHKWAVGELVFWDNRSVAHTGTTYDKSRYARLMQRTTLLDVAA